MLLLVHGADELAKDASNRNAIDYASRAARADILREKSRLVRCSVISHALFDAVEEGNVQKFVSVLLKTQNQDAKLQVDAGMVDSRSTLGWNLLPLGLLQGRAFSS